MAEPDWPRRRILFYKDAAAFQAGPRADDSGGRPIRLEQPDRMAKEHTTELLLDFGPDGRTLVPVVTQDAHTRDVLILAFVNKEAYDETRRSGYATYWSRSRNELWKKGLTSGDMLKVEEVRINCEQNSLVFLVTPQGRGACHAKQPDGAPYKSCYYRRVRDDGTLEDVVPPRR